MITDWFKSVVCADMSLKEALQFLVNLAKEKKQEQQRGHGKCLLCPLSDNVQQSSGRLT